MEEFQLQIEKLVAHADDKASTGVFSNRVSFGDGSIGTLVSCILVKGNKGSEVKNIFDLALKKLEGAESGSLEIIKNATEACGDFVKNNQLEGGFVHFLFYKNAGIIGKFKSLVRAWIFQPPKSLELKFEYGSGPLKTGQLFLIATEKFLTSFDLVDHLSQEKVDVEEIVDGLATEISAKSEKSEIAAALVYVKSESSEVIDDSEDNREIVEEAKKEIYQFDVDKDESLRPVSGSIDERLPILDASHEIAAPMPTEAGAIPKIIGAIFSEVSKLARGDIKAVFRLRRNVVAGALVLLLILGASVFFTLKGNESRETASEFSRYLQAATSKYEEGVALLDLNKERSREIFIEADNEVKRALKVKPKDEKALDLASKITAKLEEVSSQTQVSLETVFTADETLVSLAFSGKNIIAVASGKVYAIDIESKTADEIKGADGVKHGFVYDNKAFIFDGESVYRVDLATGESKEIFKGEESWDLNVFLGNVYLLGENQIFKYVPVEEGYTKSVDYLNGQEQFSQDSRLTIDGSVWVTKGSEVFEYLRGEKQDFKISGLTDGGNFGEIYTSVDADNIYVVDRQNNSLLVIDKDGIFKESYHWGEFSKASDLVVDEEAGKFYLAVGNKVLAGSF